ncbi:MAG TPA: hypothetical protein PLD59_01235, partial [Tepidisphaeraceae bacterium]|nr:hypothetical protein [Tepidisphaeraceae bacterium]
IRPWPRGSQLNRRAAGGGARAGGGDSRAARRRSLYATGAPAAMTLDALEASPKRPDPRRLPAA